MTQIKQLLFAKDPSSLAERHRAGVIASRVRIIALAFALLTPAWIIVDALIYDWPLWGYLVSLRVVSALCFALIAVWSSQTRDIHKARRVLGVLMLIPMAFFIISNPVMSQFHMEGMAQAVSMGYIFLPFVMMAGLSIFPITALEGALISLPIMGVTALLPLLVDTMVLIPFNSYFGALWLLALIAVAATFAGMSQLQFLSQLVRQSSHDPLTQALNRRAGIELLDQQFELAKRGDLPLSVAFIDLDHFKLINDNYGHEEGDNALREAVEKIRSSMRGTDLVVRWGGEEFLVIMQNTAKENAEIPLQRLLERGLGMRPDESMLTASIGLAERIHDRVDGFKKLVDLADQRMYLAKERGRACVVTEGQHAVVVDSEVFHQPEPMGGLA